MLEENALEVEVFLVRADYVWGGGERIAVLGGMRNGAFRDVRNVCTWRL